MVKTNVDPKMIPYVRQPLDPSLDPKERKRIRDRERRARIKLLQQQYRMDLSTRDDDTTDGENSQQEMISTSKRQVAEALSIMDSTGVMSPAPSFQPETSAGCLKKLMEHFFHHLQRRDVNQFFAIPLNDQIAPGYSLVVKEPMDFSTIRGKLNANKYTTLKGFIRDFELMCKNAMSFNSPDNMCHKVAKELLQHGQELYNRDSLFMLMQKWPFMSKISEIELGIADVKPEMHELASTLMPSHQGPSITNRPGESKVSLPIIFKRTETSESTTLGSTVGSVKAVANSQEPDDKRLKTKPVYPLYYGAYSSHGPTYDSTFSNVTKEETALLFTHMNTEVSGHHLEAVVSFTPAYDYEMFTADRMLDILTGNDHQKTCDYFREEENLKSNPTTDIASNSCESSDVHGEAGPVTSEKEAVDFENLKTLEEDGIDVSFLERMKKAYDDMETSLAVEDELAETATLLNELRQLQMERLSGVMPVVFSQLVFPTPKEGDVAGHIQDNLTGLAAQCQPGDVVSSSSLHHLVRVPHETKSDEGEVVHLGDGSEVMEITEA